MNMMGSEMPDSEHFGYADEIKSIDSMPDWHINNQILNITASQPQGAFDLNNSKSKKPRIQSAHPLARKMQNVTAYQRNLASLNNSDAVQSNSGGDFEITVDRHQLEFFCS